MTVSRFAGPRPGPAFALALALASALASGLAPGQPSRGAEPRGTAPGVAWRTETVAAPNPPRAFVEVWGASADLLERFASTSMTADDRQRILAVTAGSDDPLADVTLPPMAGRYEVVGPSIRFFPAFPLQPGVRYRAVFRPPTPTETTAPKDAARTRSMAAVHEIPLPHASPTTVVTAIHPTTDVLPENLLKFYVHFSAPMTRGRIYEHIHLRDAATGREVELPFLEIDEELWDPELRRLTLLLDPGRIKRGVKPLEDIGSSLESGKSYTLTIEAAWLDATGTVLKSDFTKTFRIAPPDREPPDPVRWKTTPPLASTRKPLEIGFDEPMDHAIVLRTFRVADAAGQWIAGHAELGLAERSWRFTPENPWKPGRHEIRFPTTIEDLAGNNIGKSFDVDLFEKVEVRPTRQIVAIPFTVP